MTLIALDDLVADGSLTCPRCRNRISSADGSWRCTSGVCPYATDPFPAIRDRPALVDFERSVLSAEAIQGSQAASLVTRPTRPSIVKRMLHPANTQAPRIAARMVDLLLADVTATGRRPRILVIGGGTIGDGLEALYADERIDLIGFDVYASDQTQFVADGHQIPLADGSVDGVIIQAVLEHVLEPAVVVGEIRRVLRDGGAVYADTPFMQQVHEGAYDFTRFSESGHRYLFRDFEQVESGQVAGAGTSLRWSINYFVRALTRSITFGRIAGLAFFWLSYLDRLPRPEALAGRSQQRLLPRSQGRPCVDPRRAPSIVTRAGCSRCPGLEGRRPDRRRHLGRERGADVPRRRRTLGGTPGRGRRDPRGLRPRPARRAAVLRRPPGGARRRSSPTRRTTRSPGSSRRSATTCFVVTQNIDDLHERAGSTRVLHMHGELLSALCRALRGRVRAGTTTSVDDPPCPRCAPAALRPDVVWFGEVPYEMDRIFEALESCDLFVSIGTSGAVYPAAGFVRAARAYGARTLELNLQPSEGSLFFHESRQGPAGELVPAWVDDLLS